MFHSFRLGDLISRFTDIFFLNSFYLLFNFFVNKIVEVLYICEMLPLTQDNRKLWKGCKVEIKHAWIARPADKFRLSCIYLAAFYCNLYDNTNVTVSFSSLGYFILVDVCLNVNCCRHDYIRELRL